MAIAMHPDTQPRLAARRSPSRGEWLERRAEARFRRRRAAAGLLVAGAVGVGVLVADTVLTGPGGGPASAAGAGTEPVLRSEQVRARAGDSLWSIAEQHHGDISIRRYVEALIDLNGGTAIEAGQLVVLP